MANSLPVCGHLHQNHVALSERQVSIEQSAKGALKLGFFNRKKKTADVSPPEQHPLQFFIPNDVSWSVEDVEELQRNGHYEEAVSRWQKLLTIFQEPNLPAEVLRMPSHRYIYLQIGRCYRHMESYTDAAEAFAKARQLAEESHDESMLADVASNLGLMHRARGEYGPALNKYDEALAIAAHRKMWNTMASVLDNRSICYAAQRDGHRAFSESKKAYDIVQQHGSEVTASVQARVLASLGELYVEMGKPREGRPLLEKALTRARQAGDQALESLILQRLSQVV